MQLRLTQVNAKKRHSPHWHPRERNSQEGWPPMRIIFRQSPCIPEENEIIVDRQKMTLREELLLTRNALENAYAGFDNATDPDLIDCYIYELNAVMKRYKYLLQKAAETDPLPEKERAAAYRPLTLS